MKLISLKLENYRQHRHTHLEFPEGIIGIIGPNGSGKSTLLEAIAWSVYGQKANQRDKAKDILWQRAPARAAVRAELAFELQGQRYRVIRDAKTASLFQEGKTTPLVTGLNDVTRYLEERLGMDYRAFFNSYFTRQKELTFLANESTADRQKLINKMLGLEALEKTRRNVNADRLGRQRQIEGMEKGLLDLESLLAQQKKVKEEIERVEQAWQEAGERLKELEAEREALQPRYAASVQRADQARELQGKLKLAEKDRQHRRQNLERLQERQAQLQVCGEELLQLQPELEKWEQVHEQFQEQDQLQRLEGQRQQLAAQLADLERKAQRLQRRDKELAERLPGDALDRCREAVRLAKQQAGRLAEQLRQQEIALREKLAMLDSELKTRRREQKQVLKRREVIGQGGPENPCPTCLRPVTAGELPHVLRALADQLAEIEASLADLERQRAAAQAGDEELAKLKKELADQQCHHETLQKQERQLEVWQRDRQAVQEELARNAEEQHRATARMAELPAGFDKARWEFLRADLERMKPVKQRETELRERLKDRSKVEAELAAGSRALEEAQGHVRALQKELGDLNFSQEAHQQVIQEFTTLTERCNQRREEVAERKADLQRQRGRLEELQRHETEVRRKMGELEALRQKHRYLVVLEDHLEKLRAELNGRVRPELEASASQFLEQLTDGRYRTLELDANYGIRIVDEGESFELPRFSGGEGDIAHLCLRLAISEMIIQRAGQPLSLMILDEVFGSLDDMRRDNLMNLLTSLQQRFSQIILITHIEEVRQAVERVIRVGFDEKTGASFVEVEPGVEFSEAVYA